MPADAAFDRRAALGLLGVLPLLAAARKPAPVDTSFRPDRELRVPVRGGQIYARINGGGKRAAVLFVHGGPGSSHWYFLPALVLAAERPVILYDQLDSGRSDMPGNPRNWTVERFVSEIDSVRANFELERLHIVGHSWGAALAVEYAARRPGGLASIILSGAFISTRSWEASSRQRLSEIPAPAAEAILRHERDGTTTEPEYAAAIQVYYDRFLRRRAVPPAIAAYRDALPSSLNRRVYNTMWGPGETAATGSLRFYSAEPLLPRIAVPTLFLTGQYDEMLPGEAALLARRVANAETRVVAGAGHTAAIDNPRAWVGEIGRWTSRFG